MLMSRHSGFTLIELLIGLVIVAILMFFAVPNYHTFIENQKLRARAESILSGLHTARQEAIRLNTNVSFVLTSTVPTPENVGTVTLDASGPHWLVRGAVMDPDTQTSAITLLDSQNAAETGGTALSVIEADAAEVVFTPLGRTAGGVPQKISILPVKGTCVAEGGKVRCLNIEVAGNGQIRMCDPAVDTPGDTRRCMLEDD
ncbi:MAG: GspH/FimT family pseudopilin [Burkholderiales bacterium]|nr:GspH/FimT family pseudopilin [Burkholderiales bacterium]